jgi:hypothetical protein
MPSGMFGPRLSKIFASRWMALWWAATILLMVWQLVPAPDDHDSDPATPAAHKVAAPANPWALETASPAGAGK